MSTRIFRKLLVLIALLGAFGQATAYAAPPMATMTASTAMGEMDCAGMAMAASDGDAAPCQGVTLACIAMMGCIATPMVAAAPSVSSSPVRYHSVRYVTIDATLASVTVEPEIFPPIA